MAEHVIVQVHRSGFRCSFLEGEFAVSLVDVELDYVLFLPAEFLYVFFGYGDLVLVVFFASDLGGDSL